MVKSRVHDLAAEFGVSSEQLLAMLKDMNIFVRSHMSALEGDQVSAVRVRWEREKRKQHEEEKPKKARRKKAAEAPAEVPAPVADEIGRALGRPPVQAVGVSDRSLANGVMNAGPAGQ